MSDSLEQLRDEIAVLEYRAGKTQALADLMPRWEERVYVYVLATVGNREDAWDVSQEVWLAVAQGLRRSAPIVSLGPWLYGVAHNKCMSHLRRAGRIRAHEEETPDVVAEPADPAGAADDIALAAEDAAAVRECVLQLPLAQREAIALFYVDQLSLDQIAGVLGVPTGTVQSRLFYGRLRLKSLLNAKGLGDGKG